jgi:uncharacterized protein YjbI with pentapeptide repeats
VQYGYGVRRAALWLLISALGGLVAWLVARELARAETGTAAAITVLTVIAFVAVSLLSSQGGIKKARPDIGTALLTGVAIAAAILWLQFELQHSIDKASQQQSLELTLSLQQSLVGIDLHDRDLRHLYLPDKDLREADLDSAHLQSTRLAGSSLAGAYLERADLDQAVLSNTRLSSTHLQKAQGQHANFTGARGSEVKLSYAHLNEADFDHAILPHAYMAHVALDEAELEHADFYDSQAEHALLERAHLAYAQFVGADFSFAHFNGAELTDVNFSGATLYSTSFLGAKGISSACFQGAQYNTSTRWPAGFDPLAAGAILEGSSGAQAAPWRKARCSTF